MGGRFAGGLGLSETEDGAAIARYWIKKCVSNDKDRSLLRQFHEFLQVLWKPCGRQSSSKPSTATLTASDLRDLLQLCHLRGEHQLLDLILANEKGPVAIEFLDWAKQYRYNSTVPWDLLRNT